MPYPTEKQLSDKTNKSKNKYINSRVDYLVRKEGKTTRQAVGQYEGMWQTAKKKKSSKSSADLPNWEDEKFIVDYSQYN